LSKKDPPGARAAPGRHADLLLTWSTLGQELS
jgi:hypothetical protein